MLTKEKVKKFVKQQKLRRVGKLVQQANGGGTCHSSEGAGSVCRCAYVIDFCRTWVSFVAQYLRSIEDEALKSL